MKTIFKTSALILALSLISIGSTSSQAYDDYVVTKDGNVLFSKVNNGFIHLRCKRNDGSLTKFDANEIKAYRKDGRYYEKVPYIVGSKPSSREVFMELVCQKAGLKLYIYNPASVKADNYMVEMYVFKDGKYFETVTPQNLKHYLDFFNITVVNS